MSKIDVIFSDMQLYYFSIFGSIFDWLSIMYFQERYLSYYIIDHIIFLILELRFKM